MKYYNIQIDLIAELQDQTTHSLTFNAKDWSLLDIEQLEEVARFIREKICEYEKSLNKREIQ